MKLRDSSGRWMTDNWVNRFKAASSNEKVKVFIVVTVVVLMIYEMT